MSTLKVAIIGLDTSHSVQFAMRMNAPDCPRSQRVAGLHAVSCLRFETPFQDAARLDDRQAQLEGWGVRVTEDLDDALQGADAILLEINDPSLHLEYFAKVAGLGKPVFLDKPLADTLEDGRKIVNLAGKHATRVWSGSSLPFAGAVQRVCTRMPAPSYAHCYGALGTAAAGDSLIWYGVHSFEMLQRLMGPGALQVRACDTAAGIVSVVEYADKRLGTVEVLRGSWSYGGRAQQGSTTLPFQVNTGTIYRDLLRQIRTFLLGGPAPVSLQSSFESLAMMVAARTSIETGQAAEVELL